MVCIRHVDWTKPLDCTVILFPEKFEIAIFFGFINVIQKIRERAYSTAVRLSKSYKNCRSSSLTLSYLELAADDPRDARDACLDWDG